MSLVIKISLLTIATLVLSAREPPQIELLNQGTIAGMYISRFRTKRIAAYLGIPYAQPPVGFRRLAPPEFVDVPSWEGVRNATEYPPDCMQKQPSKEDPLNRPNRHDELFAKLLESQMDEPRKREYAEDCLYLNVYVPDVSESSGGPSLILHLSLLLLAHFRLHHSNLPFIRCPIPAQEAGNALVTPLWPQVSMGYSDYLLSDGTHSRLPLETFSRGQTSIAAIRKKAIIATHGHSQARIRSWLILGMRLGIRSRF
ncbi:Carboxylesterase 1E [Eumeta japonica]|uniref:Carboxylesterase 1E n=1 Tax=Eumeta variegata TaxID=151549 RepID=A0A4C1VMI6_EUMVA|nr:Carboxylesterase 1E [Eumeta japonica]